MAREDAPAIPPTPSLQDRGSRPPGAASARRIEVLLAAGEARANESPVPSDDTTRSEMERALRTSEARLAITLDSIAEAVLATDCAGRITRMNPVAEQLTGWSFGEARDRPVCEVFHTIAPDTRVPVSVDVAGLATGTLVTLARQVILIHRSGKERHVSQTGARICPPGGEVLGAVLVFRDITEQLEMQARLVISDRMASMGTLAAGVAHEINNPLAVVINNLHALTTELAAERPSSATIDEILGEMREATERVRVTVRDLKLFSRAEEKTFGPVDVLRLLESSLRIAGNEVKHHARVTKNLRAVRAVLANESRLGQVFVNLIVNAAQAIPEGSADDNEIRLSAWNETNPDRVVIEVRDTGPGIRPDILPVIFDPFFTTKPPGVGTGLGLAICERIVAEIGGRIAVESQVGSGTAFRVTLPAAPIAAPATPMTTPMYARPAAATSLGAAAGGAAPQAIPYQRRGRVLVVDNEPLVGTSVARTLSMSHDVRTETRGAEALARLRIGERFDVILCDVMMPQMTGMDFYDALLALAPEQAARVVFITAGAFTPTAQRFLATVGRRCLDKPFAPATLLALVDRMVG